MRFFKDGGSKIHRIPSTANQRACVVAQPAQVEEVVSSGGDSVHKKTGEIVEADVTFKNDDDDCYLEGIRTAEEVKASGRRVKLRALQKQCCFASVEILANMLAVVALHKICLD